MAGIYIHIPFCRKRCHYCDFFKTTDLRPKNRVFEALKQELIQRSAELASDEISTIYLGGGTPSVFVVGELKELLKTIKANFSVSPEAEITMEANPDDLNHANLSYLREVGYNRLSM